MGRTMTDKLTKKQQQLDVNMDGAIDKTDLKRLRNGEKPDADYATKVLQARVAETANAVEIPFTDLKSVVQGFVYAAIVKALKVCGIGRERNLDCEISPDYDKVVITARKGAYVNFNDDDLVDARKDGNFKTIEVEVSGGDFSLIFMGAQFEKSQG